MKVKKHRSSSRCGGKGKDRRVPDNQRLSWLFRHKVARRDLILLTYLCYIPLFYGLGIVAGLSEAPTESLIRLRMYCLAGGVLLLGSLLFATGIGKKPLKAYVGLCCISAAVPYSLLGFFARTDVSSLLYAGIVYTILFSLAGTYLAGVIAVVLKPSPPSYTIDREDEDADDSTDGRIPVTDPPETSAPTQDSILDIEDDDPYDPDNRWKTGL